MRGWLARNSSSRVWISLTGRPLSRAEEGADDGGVVVAGLAAEAAADLGLDHAHLGFGQAERGGVAATREERRLRVAPHRDAAAVPSGDAADGLERRVPLAHRFPRAFHDDIRGLEPGRHIAALEGELVRDVAGRVVVHQCRARRERLVEREHRGQHLVADHDLVHCRARGLGVHRRDRRHFVSDIAHFVDCERIEIRAERSPFALRRVGADCDRFDAGHGRRSADVDGDDPGVRVGASQHRGVQHAGEVQVGDILRRAGDLRYGVGARNVLADDEETRGRAQPGVARGHRLAAFRARATASL